MASPQIDWTFGPAPGADEPPASLPPGVPPRLPRTNPAAALRLKRRTWLLLGTLAAVALALAVALPLAANAYARQAVEQLVARQEQARLAGNWETLAATYVNDSLGWKITRVTRLQNGWLPTPISLPGLRSDGQPGRVTRFQIVGPQVARADVTRGFVLADGTRITFAMPQFYQFARGAWLQAPPPELPLDQAQSFHGARVDLTYYPDDADLASGLVVQLDDLLTRACADWACPPELRVAVVFDPSDPADAASRAPFASLLGSLTLQIILGRPSAYPINAVKLETRVTGGYPADAAAAEALRRAAGVQALIAAAQQMAPNTLMHGENAYLDAMIAREASRLGIDEPGLGQLTIANPLFQPDELWSVPLLHVSSAPALPEALVILNAALATSDLSDEMHLMHAFNAATSADAWLAAGLGMSPTDAHGIMLDSSLYRGPNTFYPPYPLVQPAGFKPDFALSCPSGPLLGTLGGQTAPLFAGPFPDSVVEAWSPDGQRLALRLSGRLSMVDLVSLLGQFAPEASFQEGIPATWASNSLLVYPGADPAADFSGRNAGLVFFGMGNDQSFSTGPNFESYLPSPDRAWAAVESQPNGADPAVSIVPSPAGQPIFTADLGYDPAWSADSQHLAFALRNSNSSELAVFDLASREKRTLAFWDVPAGLAADSTSLLAAWSPSGDRLAVASVSDTGSGYQGWVSTLAPDGSDFRQLNPLYDSLAPAALAYSADGNYLAAELFDASGRQGVVIYLYSSVGAELRWLPGYQLQAWSPAGHILALTSVDGVSLLREPGSADAAPRVIGPAGCSGLAWRP